MYHVELRKFPHTACRFNQSEEQLQAIVVPWARQEWIEEGERNWNINEAKLTVLEGPELSMPELAMGKGWRNAQRRSEDVTARVLAAHAPREGAAGAIAAPARNRVEAPGSPTASARQEGEGSSVDLDLLADSLALQLLAMLDQDALAPVRLWQLAHERLSEQLGGSSHVSPSRSLALAGRAAASLLAQELAVLRSSGPDQAVLRAEQQHDVLTAIETWGGGGSQQVVIARKS